MVEDPLLDFHTNALRGTGPAQDMSASSFPGSLFTKSPRARVCYRRASQGEAPDVVRHGGLVRYGVQLVHVQVRVHLVEVPQRGDDSVVEEIAVESFSSRVRRGRRRDAVRATRRLRPAPPPRERPRQTARASASSWPPLRVTVSSSAASSRKRPRPRWTSSSRGAHPRSRGPQSAGATAPGPRPTPAGGGSARARRAERPAAPRKHRASTASRSGCVAHAPRCDSEWGCARSSATRCENDAGRTCKKKNLRANKFSVVRES